ncbi:helix-turn-helix domain-containing protein [Nocardia farcinica]|uniref:helix-turn-helix domain-containing protein n=1 Tax=Nocardia farcinica TaxID=37329 RepID=UPI000A388999|nr:helix-turn-helix transcriptional regulator [Nocardia farcinica]MBF6407469.1 helix-turn-helix transcriptional regulator [Nocardia farcinica]
MGTRRVEIGPTGKTVAHNVARIRKAQGLTLRDVAGRLSATDRPLAHNTISEIERGARRADVDDLIALAVALNCSPLALLFPPAIHEHVVTITAAGDRPAWEVWRWGAGERALLVDSLMDSNAPRGQRGAAASEQYRLNSDPQLQGVAGAPNVRVVVAPGDTDEIAEAPANGDD